MKLELKHLAPYLPYGLKGETPNGFGIITELRDNQHYSVKIEIEKRKDNAPKGIIKGKTVLEDDYHRIDIVKPLFRPLSDLTKEIEHNGELLKYFFFGKGGEHDYYVKKPIKKVTGLSYDRVQRLFELHFDVFGLIEKGIAVDINTL